MRGTRRITLMLKFMNGKMRGNTFENPAQPDIHQPTQGFLPPRVTGNPRRPVTQTANVAATLVWATPSITVSHGEADEVGHEGTKDTQRLLPNSRGAPNATGADGPDDTALTASIKQNICRVLTEKYSSPAIQVLLRKATILDPRYRGSMEKADALDDVKHQLVQELLDLKEPEGSGEGASGESCSKAAGGNEDEPPAAVPTKKKRLSILLQNRRAHLTGQAQAAVPKRVQADAELTKFLQEDAQLRAVLTVMTREAVRQICRVFRELCISLVKENQSLKDTVRHLETELRSKVDTNAAADRTQTLYKIKPSDGPALSLDISQPAANPAALAMAILSSAKSRRRASSNPQVPLVIISQPLREPITGQSVISQPLLGPVAGESSPAPQVPPKKLDQSGAELQTEVVLEINQMSSDPEESPGDMTSFPMAHELPTDEDLPSAEAEPAVVVVETEIKMEAVQQMLTDSRHAETPRETPAVTPTGETAAWSEEEQKEQERRRRRELYKDKRFFCELCNKGFHQKHQLRKHVSCHLKPFPCSSCDKGFYKAKSLQRHQQSHQLREAQENDPDKLLHCDQCDRKFRLLRQLRVHQASHRLEKMPLKCHVCERTFTSAGALRYHEVSHAQVKPFMCDVCGKGFTRKKSLREHQTVHTGARPYPCPTCGKSFSTASNLRVHKRSHSEERPYKCCECDKAFKCKMGLLQHRVVHSGEKPFMCQTCGLSFGLKYNFQRHLRLHNGEKPFRCDKCGEGFTGTWALKTHMLVHGMEKPFMCDLCGKTFFYNCQLQKHQQLVHNSNKDGQAAGGVAGRRRQGAVKPYSCKICLKSFSTNTTLRTHEKSHAENKEFTCDTCGKSFHLRHLYLYHMRQHSGARPYVCNVCDKGFLLTWQLKQHELLHTGIKPHKCQQCGKEFRTPQNYHRHLLVHTGEKPYECVVCGRKFRQSNQLKSHMQIHTGVKLYACERCGHGFSDSRQLKKHRCGEDFQSSEPGGRRRKQKNAFPWTEGFTHE
ncbi:hypothetical protein ABVT39_012391 [Epinephelus coioides]